MLSLCHNKPYKLESPLPKITGCSHLHQYDFLNNLLAETGTNTPQEAMTALQITASTCPTQYPKPMIFGPVRETGQGSSHIVARPISESYLSIALKMLGINDASIRSLRRVISKQRQTNYTLKQMRDLLHPPKTKRGYKTVAESRTHGVWWWGAYAYRPFLLPNQKQNCKSPGTCLFSKRAHKNSTRCIRCTFHYKILVGIQRAIILKSTI